MAKLTGVYRSNKAMGSAKRTRPRGKPPQKRKTLGFPNLKGEPSTTVSK